MTKKELIAVVANSTKNTQRDIENILYTVFATITAELSAGKVVDIAGFGKFLSTLQKGKSGTIPGSTKTYTTQDKMVPKFKAAKALKDSVAAGK